MKVSLITTCYNSAATIEDTIKSVLSQKDVELEYIIVDGGSKDSTLNIVRKYQDKIAKIISEPDKGIYDGMNKGLKLATGDIVGIINSDDYYAHDQVLKKVSEKFSQNDIDACYGDLLYVDQINTAKIVRRWKAGEYKTKKLNYGWIPPHPTFFVKKSVYEKFGYFNLDFRIAADYELLLRFIKKAGIKLGYIPEYLVCMREGGYSASSLKQRIRGWKEIYRAWTVNNFLAPKLLFITRPLFKIHQYF